MPKRLSPIDLIAMLPATLSAVAWNLGLVVAALLTHPNFSHTDHGKGGEHTSGVLFTLGWIIGGCALLFGLFVESNTWGERKPRCLRAKITRYRRRRVITEPDGEFVRLWLYERGKEPVTYYLHAESEAERAHELVAEFRAHRPSEPKSTPEARALARTLTR